MVYSEYRHELTAEYSTFYDLRRAGVAQAFVQAAYGTTSNTNPIIAILMARQLMERLTVCT